MRLPSQGVMPEIIGPANRTANLARKNQPRLANNQKLPSGSSASFSFVWLGLRRWLVTHFLFLWSGVCFSFLGAIHKDFQRLAVPFFRSPQSYPLEPAGQQEHDHGQQKKGSQSQNSKHSQYQGDSRNDDHH